MQVSRYFILTGKNAQKAQNHQSPSKAERTFLLDQGTLFASTMISTFGLVSFFVLLNTVRPSESTATVQIDKKFYCQGEMIRVTFDSVQGEGTWVGIYRSDDINGFAALPDWSTGKLMWWILTCGTHSETGCDVWPTSGEVKLETDSLEESHYTIVISEDHAALKAQAFTNSFEVVECGSPTPAPVVQALEDIPTAPGESLADFATPEPTDSPTDPPAGVLVVDGSIIGTIQAARSQIIDMIRVDNDLIGKVRRARNRDAQRQEFCDLTLPVSSFDLSSTIVLEDVMDV
jgi:hypothetical protein